MVTLEAEDVVVTCDAVAEGATDIYVTESERALGAVSRRDDDGWLS